jgi:endonuclease YncB( thermonuclease family)
MGMNPEQRATVYADKIAQSFGMDNKDRKEVYLLFLEALKAQQADAMQPLVTIRDIAREAPEGEHGSADEVVARLGEIARDALRQTLDLEGDA